MCNILYTLNLILTFPWRKIHQNVLSSISVKNAEHWQKSLYSRLNTGCLAVVLCFVLYILTFSESVTVKVSNQLQIQNYHCPAPHSCWYNASLHEEIMQNGNSGSRSKHCLVLIKPSETFPHRQGSVVSSSMSYCFKYVHKCVFYKSKMWNILQGGFSHALLVDSIWNVTFYIIIILCILNYNFLNNLCSSILLPDKPSLIQPCLSQPHLCVELSRSGQQEQGGA